MKTLKNIIMKYLLIILLPVFSYSQSFPELIREYEKDCNSIVLDTIKQHGKIRHDLVPVFNEQKEIIQYKMTNRDTIWYEPKCPEYKVDDHLFYKVGTISASSNVFWIPIQDGLNEETISISRDWVCECKKRKVYPFSDHFWDWIKLQK